MGEQHALLMLDLVDSTRLSEELGDREASALWVAHDQMARDLLVLWRGREIDKSDGFFLVFAEAADAVGYALAYHAALPGLHAELAARAGIHVGELIARDNAPQYVALGAKPVEMEGIAKATAARVMAVAQAGQTLLTSTARATLGTAVVTIHSHGRWRMKGLAEPIEIFEASASGAVFTPPPDSAKGYRVVQRDDFWLPLREVRNSLPAERDSFVGRHNDLLRLARRFDAGARLVSILGPGGSGKTRLAKRYGWTWLGDFPGGVWFCDLSQATTVDGIAYAVGQGLDVPLSGADPLAQLAHAIAGRGSCLVILDNFEQVARHAEATLGRWLDRAAEARFLVTSREALGIVGEGAVALDSLACGEGASLFLQRAAAARSGYEPTADDRAVIEPLVKLLDGLPLAIELAAARVRVMSPRMLLDRMSERFKLLASNSGRPDRQATLRATLDWSWALLSEPEKTALAQLSVFEGGFTLRAAEAVVDLSESGTPAPWVANVLQALVEKSLVRAVSEGRFDLLSTLQAYAAERLEAETVRREWSHGARQRHWQWFAALDERQATTERCVECDNLVAACRRATIAKDGPAAASSLQAAWAALKLRGPIPIAAELAANVQAIGSALARTNLAAAMWIGGLALHALGRGSVACEQFERALEIAEQDGASPLHAQLLAGLAQHHLTAGNTEYAQDLLYRAQALAENQNNPQLQCQILNDLGTAASVHGQQDRAKNLYEKALAIAVDAGDRRWEGGLLGNLGNVHFEQASFVEAGHHHRAALELAKSVGDRRWEGNAHCNLGMVYHTERRFDLAREHFNAAHIIAREIGHIRLEGMTVCNLGLVAEEGGEWNLAKTYYGNAVKIASDVGDVRSQAQFSIYLGRLHARLADYPSAIEALEKAEVFFRDFGDTEALAVTLACRALVDRDAGVRPAVGVLQDVLRRVHVARNSELHVALLRVSDLIPESAYIL